MHSIPQPVAETLAPIQLENKIGSVDLYELLFGEPPMASARPLLMALGIERNAADFVALVTYWTLKKGGPFYKFNRACGHALYREGESWQELLGMGEMAFTRARQQVATKITRGTSKREVAASTTLASLVRYWTDGQRVTWYEVNLPLLCARLGRRLNLSVVVGGRPQTTDASPGDGPTAQAGKDENAPVPAFPGTPGSARLPRKPARSPVTSSLQRKEEEGAVVGEREEVAGIARLLQAQGVFEVPAWQIALRASEAGLAGDAVLDLFLAQVEHAGRSRRAVDPVAIATWRMQHQPLQKPARGEGASRVSAKEERFLAFMGSGAGPAASRTPPGTSPFPDRQGHGGTGTLPRLPPPARYGSELPLPTALGGGTHPGDGRLWSRVLADLQLQMTRATFDRWLKDTRLVEVRGDAYTVSVPDGAGVEWLRKRLHTVVARALEQTVGGPVRLEFVVGVGSFPLPDHHTGARKEHAHETDDRHRL